MAHNTTCACANMMHANPASGVHGYGATINAHSIIDQVTTFGTFRTCTWCRDHHPITGIGEVR